MSEGINSFNGYTGGGKVPHSDNTKLGSVDIGLFHTLWGTRRAQ
jgi:hypothetical protein